MITLEGLSKRYGETRAVDALDLTVSPGRVTGFLGPNGAGKSTTMRMILGLDTPTGGSALVDGRPYSAWPVPLAKVGALLDAKALHPRRTARNHLIAMARSNGIPVSRVGEVLAIVGLDTVRQKKAGQFSLGMGQRLGIAGALLGDPEVLMFDEPVNGLDPDGVRWVRQLMRSLAAEGRTVFVSSHLMSEMQLTADQLVVIGRGKLIADAPIAEVIAGSSRTTVRVRVPVRADLAVLRERLAEEAEQVESVSAPATPGPDQLIVTGVSAERVGDLAHELGVRLHELYTERPSLEEAYMELTADSVQYGVAAAS
ncbi:ABC-2 type transport system ATP-binding protein [Kribbella orskensis]|uniref:ABC-2 type transport system ATP-binding protein n=1 Tax=Kribbella orskensis TaxID=2512216 RepID=A0ABY2BGA3_9ACTN|nr:MULTISPECIES: ATP-binding cassette domain-containing protein [Kribbella]TCN37899.1 ABC-2 type transport system ATP-binding protein [Kribbella sp. VKM Ac-2500]TCO19385.1 ABC-2 type transport system ATP-binding protein [Kribbella orskensis]